MAVLAPEVWVKGTLEDTYSRTLLEKFQVLAQQALDAAEEQVDLEDLGTGGDNSGASDLVEIDG